MSRQLPKGWATVRLGEIVTARKGKKPYAVRSTPDNGFVPYLDIQAIEKGEISTYAEAASSRLATPEDVLVVWDGARSGWVGLGREGAIGSTIMALQPKVGDRNYLYRWLQSQFQQINTNTRGTGIPHVDPEVFWNLEVPLAPLAEQRRIVAKLERLLGKVDACQQRLARIPVLLKRFRQAVLAAACSGRLTADWRAQRTTDHTDDTDTKPSAKSATSVVKESSAESVAEWKIRPAQPDEWPICRLGELGEVSGGVTKNAKRQAMGLQVPYLRVANVYENRLELGEVLEIGVTPQEFERTRLQKNDLLFVEGNGSLDQIGRVALWDGSIPRCVHQNHLIKFRAGRSVMPAYVLFQMMSPEGRTQLVEKSTSTSGLNTLSISKISDLAIPVPPLAEQQEIVRRVEALFALADRIEARFQKAKAQVDRLTQSLLAKAFRGELVPQNPNDEPAEKLLERIRAQRQSASRHGLRQ